MHSGNLVLNIFNNKSNTRIAHSIDCTMWNRYWPSKFFTGDVWI